MIVWYMDIYLWFWNPRDRIIENIFGYYLPVIYNKIERRHFNTRKVFVELTTKNESPHLSLETIVRARLNKRSEESASKHPPELPRFIIRVESVYINYHLLSATAFCSHFGPESGCNVGPLWSHSCQVECKRHERGEKGAFLKRRLYSMHWVKLMCFRDYSPMYCRPSSVKNTILRFYRGRKRENEGEREREREKKRRKWCWINQCYTMRRSWLLKRRCIKKSLIDKFL